MDPGTWTTPVDPVHGPPCGPGPWTTLWTWSMDLVHGPEGVLKFTLEPSDPSYAKKGSDAKLVWDYSVDNKQAELSGIIYRVQVSGGAFKAMLVQQSDGSVVEHPNIPPAYKGRVKMKGNATLVIVNVTSQHKTKYRCALVPTSGLDINSDVQLIVTGMDLTAQEYLVCTMNDTT
ncbi:hypothetical protein ACROYT_G028507 [Oculina patagonica]